MTITYRILRKIKSLIRPRIFGAAEAYLNMSFSQDGEDLFLQGRYFMREESVFYLDVGAHHPFRFSNTYALYQKGARGINVDATPGSMRLFNRYRRRDINLEIGVGASGEVAKFSMFSEPALNGFLDDQQLCAYHEKGITPIRQVDIRMCSLDEILRDHLPPGRELSFITIDIEGLEELALRGLDISRVRPELILAEVNGCPVESIGEQPVVLYLKSFGYKPVCRFPRTVVFERHLCD